MSTPMIKCDGCAAVFAPEQITNVLDPGVEWTFIMCPRCGAKYTVTVTDAGMRSDLSRIKQLSKTVGTDPKALKKYKMLRERVKKRSTELRSKYDVRR